MNTNFMEKSLISKCAYVLGISIVDVTNMFEMNKETNSFIRRRISFGIHNVEDNIGYMLRGLLMRNVNDFSKIRTEEVDFIRNRYGIVVEWATSKKSVILSEKMDPLILGIVGETLLREYAKILGISRKDAIKIIKSNQSVKSFLQKEKSLALLDRKSCLSVLMQNTLKRDKNDFTPIKENEIMSVYNESGIIIGTPNYAGNKAING